MTTIAALDFLVHMVWGDKIDCPSKKGKNKLHLVFFVSRISKRRLYVADLDFITNILFFLRSPHSPTLHLLQSPVKIFVIIEFVRQQLEVYVEKHIMLFI